MSVYNSFKSLAFRVHLKPTPRTQSESNAILRSLQGLGPIAVFQIPRARVPQPNIPYQDEENSSTVANLVFAHNTKIVEGLRDNRDGKVLTVVANANIPDPSIKDPFNIRGLRNRKPELAPREFVCRIVPAESHDTLDEDGLRSSPNASSENDYSDPFAVDRNSIFAEILAKTDCPSGLIHGLLPKLKDRHRSRTSDLSFQNEDGGQMAQEHGSRFRGSQGQKAGRDIEFRQLDLNRLAGSEQKTTTATEKEDSMADPSTIPDRSTYHDEFASLRDFSLMGMYREATGTQKVQRDKKEGSFVPFSNKT